MIPLGLVVGELLSALVEHRSTNDPSFAARIIGRVLGDDKPWPMAREYELRVETEAGVTALHGSCRIRADLVTALTEQINGVLTATAEGYRLRFAPSEMEQAELARLQP
ncbi:MAG: hypothetical protein GVY29_04345 [Spirochaetes bacterium]|nr:hypothetical protein [Spirochaetota bacterium]